MSFQRTDAPDQHDSRLIPALGPAVRQPFGGLHEGYQFTSRGPAAVSTVADASRWHHYVETWDGPSGERGIFIDGIPHSSDVVTPGQTFLDKSARIVFGKYCNFASDTGDYVPCTPHGYFGELNGRLDDVAIFAGALDASEVAERWNQSLTDRLARGLESKLVLFCISVPL